MAENTIFMDQTKQAQIGKRSTEKIMIYWYFLDKLKTKE